MRKRFQMFLRKAWAFFERDMIETLSFKTQILMDAVSIFAKCLVFFYLSKLIGPQALFKHLHLSTDYFGYVLAGIALTGFQASALESFAKAIYREQGAGTLEAILISPTSLETVIFSNMLWTSVFVFLRMLFYFALGIFFFQLKMPNMNPASLAITFVLGLSALSGLGMISGGLILLLKRADPLGRALNGLSQLLAGVYFPVSLLPGWLQGWASFLPLTHLLRAVRRALFEGADIVSLSQEFTALLAFTLFFLPLGILFFRYSIARLKTEGSLTSY